MTDAKLKILIRGIKIKMSNREDLEEILKSYINLTDEEKEMIRKELS